MNAPVIVSPAAAALDLAQAARRSALSPVARAIRGQITELICRYGNDETEREKQAVIAAEEGRPAYWTRRGYSNQSATLFVLLANKHSLAEALLTCFDATHPGKTATALVEGLIPLNVLAATELQDAKQRAAWIDGGADLADWYGLPVDREVA